MRKYVLLGFFITLFSCEQDDAINTEGTVIWQPKLSSIITDSGVQLKWFNYSVLNAILRPYEIVEPDKFEIYMSNKSSNGFTKLIELENDREYTYSLRNLDNGKAYYFYVTSMKKGYAPLPSDKIMVIPNKQTQSDSLVIFENSHTIVSTSIATEINKIAYVDKYYSWNGGDNCCMSVSILISNLDGSNPELLDINGYEPHWSPNNDKIVFRTENNETNLGNGIPSQIALYDYETKTITKLTSDTIFNYAPVFSENGEMILFQSTKNGPDVYSTNIWLINLKTNEQKKLTEIGNTNFLNTGRPNWIDNESFLFHAMGDDYKHQIYKSSINSNKSTKVINSDWNDYCPSMSPNDNNIAFISDRSGSNQIWLYYVDNSVLRQLTGYSSDEYMDESWSRIEWIDNQNILFTLGENRLIKQKIE